MRQRMLYLLGILSLSFVIASLCGNALAKDNNKNAHWTKKHIRKVPPIMMYEPFFSEMFDQTDKDVPYKYEEVVKLAGHSCGATSSAWEMTRIALEILYPDQTPVRGDISVYAPGAENEWNIGVIGEVITYITGAAPHTGFSGAEFGNGIGPFPGDQVYVRRNKMVYTEEPVGTWPPNGMIWRFVRLDTEDEVCVRFNFVGPTGVQPPASPEWKMLGAKVASRMATPEEQEEYITWWNDRVEYVFNNVDSLVVVTECP